jgi:hypothetical protein
MTRRDFVQKAAIAAGSAPILASPWGRALAQAGANAARIPALLPRDKSGHQFLLYSDCTVTGENVRSTEALRGINRVIQRLEPKPEFIAFPGDAVGTGGNANEWEFFLNELKWTREQNIPVLQSTSNHNTHSYGAEANFRKFNPDVPLNGPGDQKGLAYWVRRGNLLYVSVHHPAGPSGGYRGDHDFGDMSWVDEALAKNADAEYKLVAGHYPVFRINGYTGMSIPREDWEPFWATLRKHRVDAYLTSHVLAFDVQVRDGILQICSGGAGPNLMPEQTEGTHAVQIALDRQGTRYQVLDINGRVRESLVWPFIPPEDVSWRPEKAWVEMQNDQAAPVGASARERISLFRFSGLSYFAEPHVPRVDLLKGTKGDQPTVQVWVDLLSLRLYVTAVVANVGPQQWMGPIIDFRKGPMEIQLALHPDMGPGGVLWRWTNGTPWSSMETTAEYGLEALQWPDAWTKVAVTREVSGKSYESKFQLLRTDIPRPAPGR